MSAIQSICPMVPVCFLAVVLAGVAGAAPPAALGLFEDHRDIGQVRHPGSVEFNPANQSHLVAGGGGNMWATNDAFHFVWQRVSGDLTLTAAIEWPAAGGNAHRKACLLIRQGLEPGSPYVDAALHGDGLTSLQCREEPGGATHEVQANVRAPQTLRLERYGETVFMSVARPGEPLQPSGGAFRLKFQDPVYVGLGVCAHDNNVLEKALFSKVTLKTQPHLPSTNLVLESTLETIAIASKDRRAIYHVRDHIEAPNWSRDGKYFLFNSKGRIHKLAATGGSPELIDTGAALRCNNDHGLSPDGTQLAISDQSEGGRSLISILPAGGGAPRKVTPLGPSYWHGWSPDGRTLAYCAERAGEFDIYTISADGGAETRLTNSPGLDDGPEYSPDGRFIYFNSERTGTMKIWRMHADGSQPEQVTFDEFNDWFPHPSPDGKWIAFLSFEKEVKGHPANKEVRLRLMPVGGGKLEVLARLFGGQGTINVPSWSPDSRQLAFVSYRLAP